MFQFRQALFHSLFVKFCSFSFHNFERSGGALAQTSAQAVAVFVSHEFGFSVHDFQSAFSAGNDAIATAVA
jgi:hypothetical protein